MGARGADNAMPEAFDHLLDVHGNQRLVLDDQHIGRDLAGNLAACLGKQFGEFLFVGVEDFSCLVLAEAFHGDQQERLPRPRRDRVQIGGRPLLPCGLRMLLRHADGNRGEKPGKYLVQRDSVARCLGEDFGIGDDGLQHGGDQCVTAFLGSRDGARETAKERQVRSDGCGQTHI